MGTLAWLGNIIDFLAILFTGENVDNSYGFAGIEYAIWFGPTYVISIILAVDILKLTWKSYIRPIYSFIGILYTIFLLLNPVNSLTLI